MTEFEQAVLAELRAIRESVTKTENAVVRTVERMEHTQRAMATPLTMPPRSF